MGATNFSGPLFSYGDLGNLVNPSGTIIQPDPNADRGPSGLFEGYGIPDVRYSFPATTGKTGVVPSSLARGIVEQVNTIPILHAVANIAALANTVTATPMTLVTTNASGITCLVPIIPFVFGALNSAAVVTPAIALDWGFSFGTTTAGNTTIVVADSTMFYPGMPLCIAKCGGASGNTHLLTNVVSITDATHIVVATAPAQSVNPTPIGTGNIWGPSESGFPTPTAYLPYIPMGPGLFLDPRQALARALVVTCNSASGTGGNFVVVGYDVYGMAMSESIAIVPGSSVTAYGKKAFKYIVSVTPDFTDAGFTYSIGTSDIFGFNLREDYCEDTEIWWAAGLNAATTGFTAAVATTPATTTTGDVRGTILVSAFGTGSGIGTTASNGSVSALALSGRRLVIHGALATWNQLNARITQPQFAYGPTQA